MFLSLLSFPRPHRCLFFLLQVSYSVFICCSDLPSFVPHIYPTFLESLLIVSFGQPSSLHRPQTCFLCLVAGENHPGLNDKLKKLFIKTAPAIFAAPRPQSCSKPSFNLPSASFSHPKTLNFLNSPASFLPLPPAG